ncbi:hypothetical protein [Phosphitispora fastidiosa]|uniref:hypothetical protein n=1 Tax=Phosphitispora fastidiosa TaxID=2837202 RepID=UPI001E2F9A71|nr:hypothetical protein [Phosphitispora fastidiosa]MBU7005223.1 hypothetical protein [Phosphitispora fastidiosa]
MKRLFLLLTVVLIVIFSAGCTGSADDKAKQPDTEKKTEQPNNENKETKETKEPVSVEVRSREAITALKQDDMEKLADMVHPDKGIRFTPYAYVNTEKDDGNLVFTAAQVRNFPNDNEKYTWGYFDGTGEPILLTPVEYFKKFVYTADFANAEKISVNHTLGTGNALENQFEVYSEADIVEYYFSGFDEQYQGMDWQSLRLVFEEVNEKLYLVGIIHNQWTI